MNEQQPLGITELVLRDAHQSLLATRMRLDDMLPIAEKLDDLGFWSMESWGGATFDACIRYLGEDPWERIRELKKVMPKTPQQMLFRGQNILGYRHYADDLVDKFVERAVANGVDVFRIFDAMNDPRNLERAIAATKKQGGHAQGTLSYTLSPVHNLNTWLDLARNIESMGADSIAIKDMAGLLHPYTAFNLVSELKKTVSLPIHMQCHATTGLSTATYIKSIDAGIDNVDTAISSMSMTYGHTSTETIVASLKESGRDTGLDMGKLEEIAGYFREVRKKYAAFEGSLKGTDSRILVAQVPGGMLTNLENQLREQKAEDKLDEVLEEIPRVREDLGQIPLVTPTSQIVGTQAVINILMGERYKSITRETEGVLKGEYGATPASVNAELQERVLAGAEPVTCRPADLLEPEFESQKKDLLARQEAEGLILGEHVDDDVLTYALFPQVALKFLANRNNPDAFEPSPSSTGGAGQGASGSDAGQVATGTSAGQAAAHQAPGSPAVYTVEVGGETLVVKVTEGGDIETAAPANYSTAAQTSVAPGASAPAASASETAPGGTVPYGPGSEAGQILAPLAGNIFKVIVAPGAKVAEGDLVLVLEAMKMETEIRSHLAGTVQQVLVQVGDAVDADQPLILLG